MFVKCIRLIFLVLMISCRTNTIIQKKSKKIERDKLAEMTVKNHTNLHPDTTCHKVIVHIDKNWYEYEHVNVHITRINDGLPSERKRIDMAVIGTLIVGLVILFNLSH